MATAPKDETGKPADDPNHPGCPVCDRYGCRHKLVESSVYNQDWGGSFTRACWPLSQELEKAAFAALQAEVEPYAGSAALDQLMEDAREESPETLDDFPGTLLHNYWIELARDADGVEVQEYDFEGDGPGGGERYRDVYAEDPEKATKVLLKAAKEDLRHLTSVLPKKKPRSRK